MRPKERRESGEQDLFRSRLDQIIDLDQALMRLATAIDWRFLEEKFGAVYSDKPGHQPLPTRLMAGLAILKHTYDLSDEALCERWVENPYFQFFCGEEFFQRLVFDRSSLTRWRQRMGGDRFVALLQQSLATAARTRALKPSEPGRARHHGAAQGGDVPNRRQADQPGARAVGAASSVQNLSHIWSGDGFGLRDLRLIERPHVHVALG
jgi:transposase, IS5 family